MTSAPVGLKCKFVELTEKSCLQPGQASASHLQKMNYILNNKYTFYKHFIPI